MTEKLIAFIIPRMRRGGAQRVISILANCYTEKGWSVDIIALLEGGCGYSVLPQVKVHDASSPSTFPIARFFHWLKWIRKYVKQNKPSIVVSFIARVNILTILACWGYKQRIVVSDRNDPYRDGRGRITLLASRILYRYADRVVFQTKYQQRCYSKQTAHNSVILPNPLKAFEIPHVEQRKEIVNVGKLLPVKAQDLLIDAFALLLQTHSDYVLSIYGEGPERARLESRIKQRGLCEKIALCGSVDDVMCHVAGAACFVLCSWYEGMSNALNEALFMGLPCVVTPYQGVEDVIIDQQNGLIADYTPESLCHAMRTVLEQPELAEQLRKSAVISAQKYLLPAVMAQWEVALEGEAK